MGIKESILVKCDGPDCQHYAEITSRNVFPTDWFKIHLSNGKGGLDGTGFDFHSLKCVRRWARERERVEMPTGVFPCGMCDFVGKSLSQLGEHEQSEHGYTGVQIG